MTALVRYTAANFLLSQRFLPPMMLYLAVLFVFTGADSGPVLPVYAVCSAALFVCGTWLTILVVNAEDPAQRSITVVNADGAGRVLVAAVWVAFCACALLGAAGLTYPMVSGHHAFSVSVLALGVLAELTSASTAIALGLVCSRLVIRRTGWAVLLALAGIFVFLLVPNMPPVNAEFRLLAGTASPTSLLLPLVAFGAVAVALAAGSTVLTRFVAQRRD